MLGFGRTDCTSSALAEPLVSHSILTHCQAATGSPEHAGSAGAIPLVSGCLPITLKTQLLVHKILPVPFSRGGHMRGCVRKVKGEIVCSWDSDAHLGRHRVLAESIALLGRAKVCELGSELEKATSSLQL